VTLTAPPPVLPDYGGACLSNLVPGLMRPPGDRPSWLPAPVAAASQVVLLVLDGLGWEQLQARRGGAPALAGFEGGPITSVAPTTTATALSSIAFGTAPATHGMVGYRLRVPGAEGDQVLNALRWTTSSGDARDRVDAMAFLRGVPFGGLPVPVVSRALFAGTGFTDAHLRGTTAASWHLPSSIAVEVGRQLDAGAPFVYAYYEGIDTVAHVTGLGGHYDAELRAADRLVADVAAALPPGAALAVTADHGQVDVGRSARFLDDDVLEAVTLLSGEARFRWLHTRPGATDEVAAAVTERYGHEAWVRTVDQVDEENWLGAPLDARTRSRLGDVALVPYASVGYLDPVDRTRPIERTDRALVCRHGSLTAEEMLVPLVATSA
jgi:predicted AlkP superfamily pyrophosphatase or phosphodiesterase